MKTPAAPLPSATAELPVAIGRLARRLRQASANGLTPSQLSALSVIGARPGIRLSDLATVERVSPPTITRIVAGLEAQGLVERTRDDDDRRASPVQLSDAGSREMQRLRRERDQRLQPMIDQLDESDRQALGAAIPALVRLSQAPA